MADLRQIQKFRLEQKLSPQQIQLMKLIQVPTQELEERIEQEIQENPALEEGEDFEEKEQEDDFGDEDFGDEEQNDKLDDVNWDEYLSDDEVPSYKTQANNYSADDEERTVPIAVEDSFMERLMSQIGMRDMTEKQREIAIYIIGNLGDDGLLEREIVDIVDDMAFNRGIYVEEAEVEKVLEIVQSLDPAGIGARDLQECLLLQLERKTQTPEVRLAYKILYDYYDAFVKKHFQKMMDGLGVSEEELKAASNVIVHLNPKPGNVSSSGRGSSQNIIPDFFITINEGELEMRLNGRNAPELKISRDYKEMMEHTRAAKEKATKSEREAVQFIKQKIDSAKWFIEAIRQRQQTLLVTMGAIMQYQEAYFLSGDERDLRPMILKDIAEEVGLDISTISRVTSNKYVQTPYGTKLLKTFFSESMLNSDGEEVSTKEIKKILEMAIGDEDKRVPLTDQELAELLKEKGYPIARRTVAKYREQLGLPVARLRKEL
jgi:RNA polymerase sigma-54 factor